MLQNNYLNKQKKTILELRKDLDKETRNDMIQFCQDTLQLYNKEHEQESEEQENQMRINVLGVEQVQASLQDLDIIHEDDAEYDIKKRKSISLNFTVNTEIVPYKYFIKYQNKDQNTEVEINPYNMPRKDSFMGRRNTFEEQKPREFIEEGYLLKKKNDRKIYEKRYFRIRKGVLFWYLSERAQEVQNKIDLSMVEEIKEKESELTFTLNLEMQKNEKKGKNYKLKAENLEEMALWVKTLKREINKIQNSSIEEEMKFEAQKTGQGKAPLFKDYDAIRRVQRVKQKLEDKKRKQEEKEKQRKLETLTRSSSQIKQDQKMPRQSLSKQPTITDLSNRTLEYSESPKNKLNTKEKIRIKTNNCWTKFLSIFGITKK